MALISKIYPKLLQGQTAGTQASGIAPKIVTGAMATTPTSASVVQPKPIVPSAISGATAGFDMSNYKADTTEAGVPQAYQKPAFPSPINVNTAKTMLNTMKTATGSGVQAGTQMQPQNALQYNPNQTAGLNVIQQAQPTQPKATAQQPVSYGATTSKNVPETIQSDVFTQPTGFTAISGTGETKTDQAMAGWEAYNNDLATTTQQAEDLANTMTTSGMTAMQDEQTRLRKEIEKASQDLGMSDRKAELEKQYGLNQQLTELSELNKQIASKKAQYEQAITENQGRNTLTSQISGREGQLKRQMASEVGALTAMALAMQGNITAAKDVIKDTIDLEYEERKNEYDMLIKQLEWNRDDMTKAEQKEADALLQKTKDKEAQMEIEAQNKKDIRELAMEALKNGASTETAMKIFNSESFEDAIQNSDGTLSSSSEAVDVGDLTAQEKTDYLYYSRMESANDIIGQYEELGAEKIGALTQYAPNMLKSSERQQMEQAQRDFVNAVLRRESGAAISESEFNNAKQQYFPQPGDTAQTIANKRASRDTALQALGNMASRAVTAYGGAAGGGTQQVFNDTQDDVDSINQLTSTMNDTGKRIFTNAVSQGVPYSFLNRYAGEIIDVASDPSVTEQQLQDFISEAYKQVSGFNQVGGDTKQASIQNKVASAIPAGTTYTKPTDGECGYWSRKIVDYPSGTGNSLAEKTAFVKREGMQKDAWLKTGPKVGDVVFTNDSKDYGHVAIVNSINPDGSITVSESNYKGHYLVSHDRKIPLNSNSIIGAVRGKLKTNISNIA